MFQGRSSPYEADTIVERSTRCRGVPGRELVVYIQHTDAAEGLARDSEECRFSHARVGAADERLEKAGAMLFLETGLESLLRGRDVDEVVITGADGFFASTPRCAFAAAHGST